jgi:hypothetical protein
MGRFWISKPRLIHMRSIEEVQCFLVKAGT